jgi:hypothetical protein
MERVTEGSKPDQSPKNLGKPNRVTAASQYDNKILSSAGSALAQLCD